MIATNISRYHYPSLPSATEFVENTRVTLLPPPSTAHHRLRAPARNDFRSRIEYERLVETRERRVRKYTIFCKEVDPSTLDLQRLVRHRYTFLANACRLLVEAGNDRKLCEYVNKLSNTRRPILVVLFGVSLLKTGDVETIREESSCTLYLPPIHSNIMESSSNVLEHSPMQ
ncbi:hypothetical protein Moror_15063 [Moniliophthora roreri MCA 2997]|uniref:Uncharacterized protein n=2 Tax=Moniliophthora roreri TaxID=221103 RepID=V2WNY6_MONRO|nr:hypothetical protein Moror_15063 [Moniliophthora roreri MCA 2997]KAI3620801.1 hypothetical protein WG66_008775 [Moniliophthora roreri]